MSLSSKFRMALAGLTAAALIGGVMTADPADAGKRKAKKVKVVKVKKVKKGKSVKQVSKGGDAKAGNGGNGGAGGSSGNVYNTGNVNGGGAGDPLGSCLLELLPIVVADLDAAALAAAGCVLPSPEAALDLLVCLRLQADVNQVVQESAAFVCGVVLPGSGGGSVFSGDAGNGGAGGAGGNATGGAGGNNSNTSTVTVTNNDNSIDVDA